MIGYLFFWAFVFIALIVLELTTLQLISIWFSIGALAAFFSVFLSLNFTGQLLVFTAISVLLLLITRPILKKASVRNPVKTNADADVGKTASVIEEVNNALGTGRATFGGVDWIAVSADQSVIPKGSIVKIEQIQGAKLIVSKQEVPAEAITAAHSEQ